MAIIGIILKLFSKMTLLIFTALTKIALAYKNTSIFKKTCVMFSSVGFVASYESKLQIHSSTLAQFIWNAEISVSVAIHCYERLF